MQSASYDAFVALLVDRAKRVRLAFPSYDDGQIHFDTDRIAGHAWEVDGRALVLTWSYEDAPSTYLYELILLSDDGARRSRVWQWIEDGVCVRRTLVDEHGVG